MITFEIINKTTAELRFDKYSINDLVTLFSDALKFGASVQTISSGEELSIIRNENCSKLNIYNEKITIEIDSDELEYVIERLNLCQNEKSFYPAELSDLQCKNRNLIIYGFYQEV